MVLSDLTELPPAAAWGEDRNLGDSWWQKRCKNITRQLFLICRYADVVGLADGQRACGDDIGLDSPTMTGLGDSLRTEAGELHQRTDQEYE